jgi:ABC-type uncharacterized transport system ATPase component
VRNAGLMEISRKISDQTLELKISGRIIQDFKGAEKKRLRVDDLMSRFEEVRRAEQLDESAAEMLRRLYV